MTSLRSKWQNFFKFDGDFISEKYSPKFSLKQKTLVGCQLFFNSLRSKSPHCKTANDFSFFYIINETALLIYPAIF